MGIKSAIHFLREGVWAIPSSALTPPRSFLLKQLRTLILALRGFNEDKCSLQASALTLYCLMSIVPVMAMAVGIAKGFGFEEVLKKELYERFPDQTTVLTKVVAFAEFLLEETRGGVVAGIGVAVLFFVVMKLLSNIERSFNDIWGIQKGRSLARQFSDYLAVMIISPVLLIMSSSLTVFLSAEIIELSANTALFRTIHPAVSIVLRLLPYLFTSILLTFLYIFMPNTKIRLRPALLGGIVGGIIYQAAQWAYIKFQVAVTSYSTIYGGFVALPLFLLWLQMSWLIVLLGAEISFAYQNVDTYEFEPDSLKASLRSKQVLALKTVQLCLQRFSAGISPWKAEDMSHELAIPVRLIREILFELVGAGILVETRSSQDEPAYSPARPLEALRVGDVLSAMARHGRDTLQSSEKAGLENFQKTLAELEKQIEESPANYLIKDV